ncbi:CBS domain-containing protein [Psychrobacter sp. ER1]|uniref:CBS domain-containing protein n=1 Tax=Psychrobacter sp. ER1 TaxID=3406645 RepID=UPI003B432351
MTDWQDVVLTPASNIRDAMRTLDETALRIAIVCDENDKLVGTVTDGDIRRGLLKNSDMQDSVSAVMNQSPRTVTRLILVNSA